MLANSWEGEVEVEGVRSTQSKGALRSTRLPPAGRGNRKLERPFLPSFHRIWQRRYREKAGTDGSSMVKRKFGSLVYQSLEAHVEADDLFLRSSPSPSLPLASPGVLLGFLKLGL